MNGKLQDLSIYTADCRSQRAAMVLKNVRYGITFHFALTGIREDQPKAESEKKHFHVIKRRIENGQYFRPPCFGCNEFPVRSIQLVEQFDTGEINPEILASGDVDLGYMLYKMQFADGGQPVNGDWDKPKFSDQATAVYYRPHMVRGVIEVAKYAEGIRC